MLAHTLVQYGIETTFVDPFNFDEVEAAIKDNTKAVFIETLGNPNSDVVDIEKLADIAHAHKFHWQLTIHLLLLIWFARLNMVLISWYIPQQNSSVDMVQLSVVSL